MKYLFLVISWCFLSIACTDTPTEESTTIEDSKPIEEPKPEPKPEPNLAPIDTVVAIDSSQMDTVKVAQKIERPTRKPPKIKFETTSYLYDTIDQGDIVEYSFKFKNVGERPLSIKDVTGSCGCTIASYSFLDIAPNEESEIKARFDSKGKHGPQFTTITVYSNANAKGDVLSLKGVVRE